MDTKSHYDCYFHAAPIGSSVCIVGAEKIGQLTKSSPTTLRLGRVDIEMPNGLIVTVER